MLHELLAPLLNRSDSDQALSLFLATLRASVGQTVRHRQIGVLDGQAPDIEVVADGVDDVDDEAAVDADGEAERAEDEGDLVDVIAEGGRPADDAQLAQQQRAHAVSHAEHQRQRQHVVEREPRLR